MFSSSKAFEQLKEQIEPYTNDVALETTTEDSVRIVRVAFYRRQKGLDVGKKVDPVEVIAELFTLQQGIDNMKTYFYRIEEILRNGNGSNEDSATVLERTIRGIVIQGFINGLTNNDLKLRIIHEGPPKTLALALARVKVN